MGRKMSKKMLEKFSEKNCSKKFNLIFHQNIILNYSLNNISICTEFWIKISFCTDFWRKEEEKKVI